ncbi:MAG: hypothetical protein RSA84_16590, partial [Acinetobacter sp.]
VYTVTNRWRSKRSDIEPLIMLEGCTLSNTVKPEHVSGFTVWGNRGRSLKWYAGLFHVKE